MKTSHLILFLIIVAVTTHLTHCEEEEMEEEHSLLRLDLTIKELEILEPIFDLLKGVRR